jgi:hypothetical protein
MANLPLLPKEDEKLDLKSSAFRDKSTGRYTRMVNLEDIVTSIHATFKSILSIDNTTSQIAKRAELIENTVNVLSLSMLTQRKQQKVAKQETKQPVALTQKASARKADSLEKIMGYLGLFTLLKNQRLMDFVGLFFKKLLSLLGVSNETIEKLSIAAKMAKEAFKMYLGYKILRPVYDSFLAIKRLAYETGVLSLLTAKEGEKLSIRERALRGRDKLGKFFSIFKSFNKTIRATKIFFKRIVRNLKGVIKGIVTRFKTVVKTVVSLKKWKELVKVGLQTMRKGVQAIKAAAAFTLVGYLIGAAVDAVLGTALDYLVLEEKQPGQSTSDFILQLLKKNVIQSLTFGMASGDSVSKEQQQKNLQPLIKASGGSVEVERLADALPKNLTKEQFVVAYNNKFLKLRAAQDPSTIKRLESQREQTWEVYHARQLTAPSKAPASSSIATPTKPMVEVKANAVPQIQPLEPVAEQSQSIQPLPKPDEVGVAKLSQQVVIDKKINTQQMSTPIVLNNINNNTTVVPSGSQMRPISGPVIFSDTVGF